MRAPSRRPVIFPTVTLLTHFLMARAIYGWPPRGGCHAIPSVGHQVYTWGDKENGVVGHTNADGHQYLPRMLESLQAKTVKQVAACGFHTAALTDAGEMFTWGEGVTSLRVGYGGAVKECFRPRARQTAGTRNPQQKIAVPIKEGRDSGVEGRKS